MTKLKQVHTFHGREFSNSDLLFLRPSFRESYREIINKNADRPFLRVYERSETVSRTFGQFDQDVLAVLESFETLESRFFVSVGTNTYRHLVYLTAAMLRGMTICPINPAEGPTRVAEKVLQLKEDAVVYCDDKQLLAELIVHCERVRWMELPPWKETKRDLFRVFPPEQPLVCVFTSGSTGHSKLVEQMERNVLANVDALIGHHRLGPGTVLATSMPIFHVSALEFSFFGALFSGASLILYSSFDLATVTQSLTNDRVQILCVVPALIQLILDRRDDFYALREPEFRYLVCGASSLTKASALDFLESFQKPIVQGYGLSEAVQSSTCMPVDLTLEKYRYWLGAFGQPSIGVALRGNEVQILDSSHRPVPAEQEGEFCIRGFNVMRGYRGGDPQVLFSSGFLETGDLGYFVQGDKERFYFISGRKKEVIKRLSETVSLREVDEVIQREMGLSVQDSISVGFSHHVSGEEVGLVVNHGGRDIDAIERVFLPAIRKLPFFMQPKVILITSEKLRTENGKPLRWKFAREFSHWQSNHFSQTEAPIIAFSTQKE